MTMQKYQLKYIEFYIYNCMIIQCEEVKCYLYIYICNNICTKINETILKYIGVIYIVYI